MVSEKLLDVCTFNNNNQCFCCCCYCFTFLCNINILILHLPADPCYPEQVGTVNELMND